MAFPPNGFSPKKSLPKILATFHKAKVELAALLDHNTNVKSANELKIQAKKDQHEVEVKALTDHNTTLDAENTQAQAVLTNIQKLVGEQPKQ